jgi:hypothetical protein
VAAEEVEVERLVADSATTRLINWLLGVGSIVTGGLLLWIGSTTYELAQQQAVTSERLQQVTTQQVEANRSVNAAANQLGNLTLRVQRVEDRIEARDERDESRE